MKHENAATVASSLAPPNSSAGEESPDTEDNETDDEAPPPGAPLPAIKVQSNVSDSTPKPETAIATKA